MASLEGDQLAGMFAAMEGEQLAALGGDGLVDAFANMGADHASSMGGENLAEMFGAMGGDGLGQLDPAALEDAAKAMDGGDMLQMGADAALGMFETLGAETAATTFTGDQLGGIFGALDPTDIGSTISPEVLLESTEKMTIEHFANVGGEQAGAMFEALGSDQVLEFGLSLIHI